MSMSTSLTLAETSAPPADRWRSADGIAQLHRADACAYLSALPDHSVDCIWTDPPYLLSNGGGTCVAGQRVSVDKGSWDQSQGLEADHEFNVTWLRECYRVLRPEGTLWVTGTVHIYLSVGMALLQLGFRILNDITWLKPNPPPNLGCRCFTHATETILWATPAAAGSKHRYTFNYADMKRDNGGTQMQSVWRIATPGRDETRRGKHPTQKPVALVARSLRASTQPGDLVLDPFTGSGTTGVAALSLGRRFIGCEQDETYFRLSVARLSSQLESPLAGPGGALSAQVGLFQTGRAETLEAT